MKKQHLIYLIGGVVITLLYFLFRIDLFESLFYAQGYSDDMYNTKLYTIIPTVSIVTTWGCAAIYYYVINSVRFDRWYHWLAVLAVVVVLTPIVCYLINIRVFNDLGKSYPAEALIFEFVNMLWTALLFIVASFSMRWWSSNCRHTPIPQ